MYETKGGAVERFMRGLTGKSKVKRYQAYGDKISTMGMGEVVCLSRVVAAGGCLANCGVGSDYWRSATHLK